MTNFDFPKNLISRLKSSKRISVLTGAGISAESGVPTFRGKNGIWKKFNPQELANMEAFLRNPELVWEWYNYRRKIIDSVLPNPGHEVLAQMEQFYPHFSICTQNVDGLHKKAGSKRIYELHGNIHRNKCSECDLPVADIVVHKDGRSPRCLCGGLIRPDVVWFGEQIPQDIFYTCVEEAVLAEVYFSIGTSTIVYPAATLPGEAKKHGAYVIEINLEPTPFSNQADYAIHAKAGDILPQIWGKVKSN